jgi:hypothetical protein
VSAKCCNVCVTEAGYRPSAGRSYSCERRLSLKFTIGCYVLIDHMLVKSVATLLNLVKIPTTVNVNCCVFVITDYCGCHFAESCTASEVQTTLRMKGKAVSLQAWSGPESSRTLRFPDYMTVAQDGGKVVSLTHWAPLPPGNAPGTHFC